MSLSIAAAVAGVVFAIAPAFAATIVPVAHFQSIELEGGGHITVRHGDVQQLRLLEGSTAFTRFFVEEAGKLRVETCKNDCPNHYDLEVEIVTPRIRALAISGGGATETAGEFPRREDLTVAIDGGGTIDARAIDAVMATTAINGGGIIKIKAEGNLTAAIDGGGEIRYWGDPHVTSAIDGGGKVERGN